MRQFFNRKIPCIEPNHHNQELHSHIQPTKISFQGFNGMASRLNHRKPANCNGGGREEKVYKALLRSS
jgi:hypothetical protein